MKGWVSKLTFHLKKDKLERFLKIWQEMTPNCVYHERHGEKNYKSQIFGHGHTYKHIYIKKLSFKA